MLDTNEAVQAVEAVDTNEAVEAVEAVDTNEAVEAVFDNSAYWNRVFSRYDENVWKNRRLFEAAVELGREMERGEISTNFVPSALVAFELKQSANKVAKAERALVTSASENTRDLVEKLVDYAVRKSTHSESDYVYLTNEYDTFDEDVLEACNFKHSHIYRVSESCLRIVFEFTSELLSTAESLGISTTFVADYSDDDGCEEAYLCKRHSAHFYTAVRTTSDMYEKSATEQYEAYCAFNEKLQELVTKLYTQ
jgi:hypothetical protein